MQKILLFSLCLLLFVSCHKDDKGWENELYPIVGISTPTDNQVFSASQAINITGLISDSHRSLTQIQIHVYNNVTGQLLFDINRAPDRQEAHSLDETVQLQAGIQYKIQVIAINKASYQGKRSVIISVN